MDDAWVSETQRFGDYWVAVTLEKAGERTASTIPLHVSISVSPEDSFLGSDVEVELLAGENDERLQAIEQPDPESPVIMMMLRFFT